MSPIYFYNGKILTENRKIAINQACCCEEVCETAAGTCDVLACGGYPDVVPPYYFQPTEQDAQDTGDSWVADFETWAGSIDLVQAFTDAGYANVTTGGIASAFPVTACGYDPIVEGQEWGWTASWGFSADCLCPGGIDYEAEPTVIWDPGGNYGNPIDGPPYPPLSPDAPGFVCFPEIVIYPCVEERCNEGAGWSCSFDDNSCAPLNGFQTEQEAQDEINTWFAEAAAFFDGIGFAQALIDAGYQNVTTDTYGPFVNNTDEWGCEDAVPPGTTGYWGVAGYSVGGDCCGNKFIDYEAATLFYDINDPNTTVYPPLSNDTGAGWEACMITYYLAPCVENPLP